MRLSQSIIYELINLTLAILCVYGSWIFIHYIWSESRQAGWRRLIFGPREKRFNAAIGLAWLIGGETGMRSWFWLLRFGTRVGWDISWMNTTPWWFIPVGFAIIQIVGLLCIIRVFWPTTVAFSWSIAILATTAAIIFTLILFEVFH